MKAYEHNFQEGDLVVIRTDRMVNNGIDFRSPNVGQYPVWVARIVQTKPEITINVEAIIRPDGSVEGIGPWTEPRFLPQKLVHWEHIPVGEWIQRRMKENPGYVTSEAFQRYAPRELRDQYPEAGADFGFFSAKRTNESLERGTPVGRKEKDERYSNQNAEIIVWRLPNGKIHREDGPAIERSDGTWDWYNNGNVHRKGGPAMRDIQGNLIWVRHGKVHREGDPAIESADGGTGWYKNGLLHRVDGPAIEDPDGRKSWWRNGQSYREGGPAFEAPDGTLTWYRSTGLEPYTEKYTPTQDEVDGYLRREITKDPAFVTSHIFRVNSSPELRREYPEAGADFGFFGAVKESLLVYDPEILTWFHHTHFGEEGTEIHHCGGAHAKRDPKVNYRIRHCSCGKHAINKKTALGHDVRRRPRKVTFTEKCPDGGWHVESGVAGSKIRKFESFSNQRSGA